MKFLRNAKNKAICTTQNTWHGMTVTAAVCIRERKAFIYVIQHADYAVYHFWICNKFLFPLFSFRISHLAMMMMMMMTFMSQNTNIFLTFFPFLF